jgi:hypothetical protein
MPRSYDSPLRDRFTQCAATFFAPANIRTPLSEAWVVYHPIGIIVAFGPYSVPQNHLVCVAGPDIAIGDPVLTKHAPHQLKTQRSVLITKRGATMSMHDAEYVSQRRGIRPRGPLSVPPSLQDGTELQRLKSLPWPRNLFGEHATIGELLAPRAARGEECPDDLCACGCAKEHRQRVSRILPNPHGKGFDLVHFWSIACESRWTWTQGRQQLDGRNHAAPMLMEDSCRSSVLAPGTRAPEFTLHGHARGAVANCVEIRWRGLRCNE